MLKYVKSQRSYGFFNHKRADFWLPNFGFKRSLLSLLKVFYKNTENGSFHCNSKQFLKDHQSQEQDNGKLAKLLDCF